MVEGDSEPVQPIAVSFPASSEAIDALLGTKRGSPRVVPNETKLAIANCASRSSARAKTFGAVGHVFSSWYYRRLDHPFFTVALHEPVRFFNATCLRRSRSAAQLHVGKRRASKGVTEPYEGVGVTILSVFIQCRSKTHGLPTLRCVIFWKAQRSNHDHEVPRRARADSRNHNCLPARNIESELARCTTRKFSLVLKQVDLSRRTEPVGGPGSNHHDARPARSIPMQGNVR